SLFSCVLCCVVYLAVRLEDTSDDDVLFFRCTADGCAQTPGVFAVRTDGGASCSDEAMYPALAAAFPDAPYHGANPHVIGNLVLWLGLAGHGPAADRPRRGARLRCPPGLRDARGPCPSDRDAGRGLSHPYRGAAGSGAGPRRGRTPLRPPLRGIVHRIGV